MLDDGTVAGDKLEISVPEMSRALAPAEKVIPDVRVNVSITKWRKVTKYARRSEVTLDIFEPTGDLAEMQVQRTRRVTRKKIVATIEEEYQVLHSKRTKTTSC